jgi:hypothetical protein
LVVVGLLLGRENDHRDGRVLGLDLGAKTVAARPVQSDIAQDDGRALGANFGKRGVGRICGHDAIILACKSHLQYFAHRDAVVDGEQGRGHLGSP